MYINDGGNTTPLGYGGFAAPPTLVPRCHSRQLRVPATLAELESLVMTWIATCVQSERDPAGYAAHRERKLVPGNPTLRDIWTRILRFHVGKDVTINAQYDWSTYRVESIRFTTTALPPPPPPVVKTAPPPVVQRPPPPPTPSLPPYKDPFPNLLRYCPFEHRKAMDALLARQKMDWFMPTYKEIYDAAANASLSLGQGDTLVINPEKTTFIKLLGDELGSNIAQNILEKLSNRIFDEAVAKYFGLIDIFMKIAAIYQGIQNVKLVNEQRKSMFKEAWRTKVGFFVDVKAKLMLRKNPGADPFKLRAWLWESFWRYDELRSRVAEFYTMEETQCGRFRSQTRMNPA